MNDEKTEQLLTTIADLQEESVDLAKDNHELLKAIDWKLWEILKIAKSFAAANNIEVKEPFSIDNQDD